VTSPRRYVVIHGHFYQPPRENPWLETVEVQDAAAPAHDWNERVTDECYAPNTAARRLDDADRILDITNNYERIAFNVGPTLMAWLARERPPVADAIVSADRASVGAHSGHGNALAQIYNHMIMPLASRRDKVTQVRWGIEDFRWRFGRDPEGMWLPETAVDDESLAVLAEAGLRFTILAPHQAARVRPLDGDEQAWTDVGEQVDPSRAYLWRGANGAQLAIFFYDGPISRAIAFEGLLRNGHDLAARLRAAFSDERDWPQLVHVATDGESYGHHSRFGDMALAAALHDLAVDPSVVITNYGEYLALAPPTMEVEVRQRTSWSCAHGVERWRADCGCRVNGTTHQRWRAPLREALDWLRDSVDPLYEARAGQLLKDPWQARDDYAAVVLDRSPARVSAFFERHARAPLDEGARLEAQRLLELQRNRALMYTSCGWFFDELSGLEPVQILRYAALVTQYARELGGGTLEEGLIRRLQAAPTNVPEILDGGEVYRRLVRPAAAELRRVVAHYAISSVLERYPGVARIYAYQVTRLDEAIEAYQGTGLRVGHVRVTAGVTGETREMTYAVIHFGGHDFSCGVRAWEDTTTYEAMKLDLLARYAEHSMADMVRGMDTYFPGEPYELRHLFLEGRRRVLADVTRAALERHEESFRHVWEETRKLVRYLREVDAPVPEALALAGRHVMEAEARAELDRTPRLGSISPRVFEIVDEAAALGLPVDLRSCRPALRAAVAAALTRVAEAPAPGRVAAVQALIEGARRLRVGFDRWSVQNRVFDLWRTLPAARPVLVPLAEALEFALPPEATT
jgi:alpha-amylase/alpha-mannosidase (GH57 family)